MRWLAIALCLMACGGPRGAAGGAAVLRPTCAATQYWNGHACSPRGDAEQKLAAAVEAMAKFDVDTALPALTALRDAGPHRHETMVTLYEQLGIAHAYLNHEKQAREAFDMLLTLSPRHLLSYTLSPQATFVFEKVRRERASADPTSLDLSWPRDLEVSQPIPVEIEVLSDPKQLLAKATLEMRTKGSESYRGIDVELPAAGSYRRLTLPAPGGDQPRTVELHLRAFDRNGNEVLRWGSPDRPREIPLGYTAPTPWYRHWWVWAIAGSAVAAGTGVTVWAIQREPPDLVDGGLDTN